MSNSEEYQTVFGMPVGVVISVGDYWDYSGVALKALVEKRYYECVAVCAVMVDIIVSDILDNLPAGERDETLRRKPVGAILKELSKTHTNRLETRLLEDLQQLNKLRIRVVHPGSDKKQGRISPDNCPKDFAQEFFGQLERIVDDFGGYSNRQFGEDLATFVHRRSAADPEK
jgi:hypothetical protein